MVYNLILDVSIGGEKIVNKNYGTIPGQREEAVNHVWIRNLKIINRDRYGGRTLLLWGKKVRIKGVMTKKGARASDWSEVVTR
jgi:hypothetical protein